MDKAGSAREIAVTAAACDDDLLAVLSRLVHVTLDRRVIEGAVSLCEAQLTSRPDDRVEQRARQILTAALSTTLYRANERAV